MSRGDEIEEGSPRRGWQPPAGGYDDDEPGDRSAGGVGVGKPNRSGMVTAVGIAAIILGSLAIMGGVCGALVPAIMPALMDFAAKANPNDPNLAKAQEQLNKIPVWYQVGRPILNLVWGLGLVIGGIGTLKRSNGGRVLTLILAALGLLELLATLGTGLAMGFIEPSGLPLNCVNVVFTGGFAVFSFAALLSPKNAAEFRS
jgi:hypothetical protein